MTSFQGVRAAPEGIHVYNPAFDVTPHRYITAIITEAGLAGRPFVSSIRNLMRDQEIVNRDSGKKINKNNEGAKKLFLFDFDGVVVDSLELYETAVQPLPQEDRDAAAEEPF